MKLLRKILFPFSAIYGLITYIRNVLFDRKILKSNTFGIPIIAVGNLSVGGTGKSPQIEYLIRLLDRYKVATLSRGYKRKSTGFLLADSNSTAETLGDEPFQFHAKFPNVAVAVDADRSNGISQLMSKVNPDVILLDDAFQHRKVRAGFYILLTSFGDLYCDDFILPTGNLRESRRGAKRADIIVVTKCPRDLSDDQQLKIQLKLKLKPRQQLFFSTVEYNSSVSSDSALIDVATIKNTPKLLVAGIAKPKSFFDFLKSAGDSVMEFPDHHSFSETDINSILKKADGRIIVTTEKDYVRLRGRIPVAQLFYLPIKSAFIDAADTFDKTILNYVGKSTTNR